MSTILFEAKLVKIGSWTIVRLPKNASAKLPSRGIAMVKGTINGFRFVTELEPDGEFSHWFRVRDSLGKAANAKVGDTVMLQIEPTKDWPEPELPVDLKQALAADPQVQPLWLDITPLARWDWIRWIRGTHNAETRRKRIEVAFSKLENGIRRPCCFNRAACTEPDVSKNGVLLKPAQTTKKSDLE